MTRVYRPFSILIILGLICLRFLVSDDLIINWDAPILIDGSYRVLNGQIPHLDFSTPIGPIIFIVGSFGMSIGSASLLGLNLGFIVFSIFLLIFSVLALRKSLSPNLLTSFAVFLSTLLFTPRMLSARTLDYGYTGIYNLYGYATFFIAVMITFGDLQSNHRRSIAIFMKGFWIGALIVVLLFLKNIFGFGLMFMACIYFSLLTNRKPFVVGVFLGLLLLGMIFVGYFHADLIPVFRDQYFVMESRLEEHPFSRKDFVDVFLRKTLLDNLYIFILFFLGPIAMPKLGKLTRILALSFMVLGYIFCASIMQWPEHILSSFLAFLMVCYLIQYQKLVDHEWRLGHSNLALLLMGLSIILIIKFMVINMIGLISDAPRLLAKAPPTFAIKDSRKITASAIEPIVIRNYLKNDHAIFVGQNNLMSYQLLSLPTKNDLLYWQNQVTFTPNLASKNTFFLPENIFNGITLIVLNKKTHGDTVEAFQSIYKDYIGANFELVDSNENISIYRRKEHG